MSYDFFNNAFIVSLVLSVIMLIVTVLLFFILNIRAAIGDITGLNKRKAIEDLQSKNKTSKSDNRLSHKETQVDKAAEKLEGESVKTSKISPQDRYDTLEAPETSLLTEHYASETTVLNSDEAVVEQLPQSVPEIISDEFYVESDITYVHSNEVIR